VVAVGDEVVDVAREHRLDPVVPAQVEKPFAGRRCQVVVVLGFASVLYERRVVGEHERPLADGPGQVLLQPGALGGFPLQARAEDWRVDDDEVASGVLERSEWAAPVRLEHAVVLFGDRGDRDERIGFVSDVVVACNEMDRSVESVVDLHG